MSFGPLCPICQSFSCDCAAMRPTKGDVMLVIIMVVAILSALAVLAAL